jgi:hypothetical protein
VLRRGVQCGVAMKGAVMRRGVQRGGAGCCAAARCGVERSGVQWGVGERGVARG